MTPPLHAWFTGPASLDVAAAAPLVKKLVQQAASLAQAAGNSTVSAMHVTSSNTLLSFYPVGSSHHLLVALEASELSIEQMDTAAEDQRVQPLLQQLALVLV